MTAQTIPMAQWEVERALRKKIKTALEEEGIVICRSGGGGLPGPPGHTAPRG